MHIYFSHRIYKGNVISTLLKLKRFHNVIFNKNFKPFEESGQVHFISHEWSTK